MQGEITTRIFEERDYDPVVQLWQEAEGVEVAEGDDRATLTAYLRRNPNLSRVAERGGRIIGAVLCGHDGRRGLIYHLAVAQAFRGQGIGRRLVEECVAGLRACGLKRVLILVARDNGDGHAFWRAQHFEEISGAVPFGRDID
jgi:putative acetyltransferase